VPKNLIIRYDDGLGGVDIKLHVFIISELKEGRSYRKRKSFCTFVMNGMTVETAVFVL
jgi:hypothetical protein